MEAVEEPPLHNASSDPAKIIVSTCEENPAAEISVQSDVCHKSNGVADSGSEQVSSIDATGIPIEEHPSNIIIEEEKNTETIVTEHDTVLTEVIVETPISAPEEVAKAEPIADEQNLEELALKTDNNEDTSTEAVEVDDIVEMMPENVRFETEILIETNVDEQPSKYKIIYDDDPVQPEHNNILNDLGQNIELSEVLRSSDITENNENNNCEVAQEVFNKEELLDILEGNDMEESRKDITETFAADCKKLETQLALQQLSRLKQARKSRNSSKKPEKKTPKKGDANEDSHLTPRKRSSRQKEDSPQTNSDVVTESKVESVKKKISKQKDDNSQSNSDETTDLKEESTKKKGNKLQQKDDHMQSNNVPIAEPKKHNIVNALVQDWEDDEPAEVDIAKTLVAECGPLQVESEAIDKSQEAVTNTESKSSNADTPVKDGQTPNQNKSDSEIQPQRRLSRVIKKKVIFDPDNPDTFTKTKVVIKKENQSDKDIKDQPTPKKTKTDPSLRSNSKSPIQSKLQWKKPQFKAIKTNKRLTEIDRLLMDEGAVNMICQLTPEAPQGNKNMKSKAEFIKKIQSSTPEGKEMKFRERKKEYKSEEGDIKMRSSKDRLSLSSSVKSPSVSEDFEAHSADDSIIYRRHSSSSYSSPCMSPRRMSDVEIINQNAISTPQQPASDVQQIQQDDSTGPEAFMAASTGTPTTAGINKTDLMSIKEKLNSKLSLALNKRKRESTKTEKPPKIKKVSKSNEKSPVIKDFKYVRLTTDQRLAEICIQQIGTAFNVEVMNELRTALDVVENKNDISVTLLTAESGALCSGLDLNSILDQENGANHAIELAESARSLLSTLESHSKLLCAAVEDRCHGMALSLVALSDVAVASEKATFELSRFKGAPLQPGAGALMSRGLSQTLLNDIIVFERPISASEALQGGLVSRVVWPERVQEQARAIAKDIAAQPQQNIMLKKQLLRLKRGTSESFLTGLQAERDLFVNYWTSAEGRELVRASVQAAKE